MIQAVGIGNQRSCEGTEVEQTIPIGIVACQSRDLEAEDDADPAHGDLGGHMGEAGTTGGLGAGKPQIIIDDGDGGPRPSQPQGFIDQRVLTTGRLGVVLDLGQRGLANIDEGGPPDMVGADGGLISHGWSPRLGLLLRSG